MRRYLIPILVLIFMLTSGVLVGCGQSELQPPYFKAEGELVHLVNDSSAYDHTWREVAGFLQWDTTDEGAYTTEHMCGYFAEELHTKAEYYGFKTAFVVVEFEDEEPHALNAFNTVDYGLVYIDCTGEGRFEEPFSEDTFTELVPVEHWDKVAYLVEGERMGFISLGFTENDFSYDWYEICRARLGNFERDMDKYNGDMDNYNKKVDSLTPLEAAALAGELHYVFGSLEYTTGILQAERQGLIKEKNRLNAEWKTIRGYVWEESDSPVTHIEVYW